MRRETVDRAISVAQLASILGGVVYLGLEVGRKDARFTDGLLQVQELKNIVTDLTKVQISLSERSAMYDQTLRDIRSRVERLESR